MPKYSQFKYSQAKYGRYSIEIQDGISLGDITSYRLKTIDSRGIESRPIVSSQVVITGTDGPVKIRLKAKDGPWIHHQNAIIKGQPPKIRIKSVTKDESSIWVESASAIARKKGSNG